MTLSFRWLGVAGVELRLGSYTLLVDPFFTRPGLWAMLSGRARQPDPALAARCAPSCDHILVTHPHYDHLLDVPAVMRQTGAPASGSRNAVELLALLGQPRARLDALAVGDQRRLGPWSLSVLPNWHLRSALDFQLNGALRPGLPAHPHLLDYRMDACFSYLLEAGSAAKNQHSTETESYTNNSAHAPDALRVLIGSHPAQEVDLAFVLPYLPAARLRALLDHAHPRCLVAIHWDDFFRPLSKPLRPIPLYRPSPAEFARRVKQLAPHCEVIIPEIFKEYKF